MPAKTNLMDASLSHATRNERLFNLPHDADLERKCLARAIQLNDIGAMMAIVSPDDIAEPQIQFLYQAAIHAYMRCERPDLLEMKNWLYSQNLLSRAGGESAIMDLCIMDTRTFQNVEILARKVRDLSQKRKYIRSVYGFLQEVNNGLDLDVARAMLFAEMDKISHRKDDTKPLLDLNDLLTMDLPPREEIIEGVLPAQSLTMIFGQRGLGKTHLALSLAKAIATGSEWMSWNTGLPRRVLYFDGEMPLIEIQQRLKNLFDGESSGNLSLFHQCHYMTSNHAPLLINEVQGQQEIERWLRQASEDGNPYEVLVFDNLSALAPGNENDNDEQTAMNAWLMRLRGMGYSIVLLHHSGKNPDHQRGASRREDILDLVIRLTPPSTPHYKGAEFTLEFTKSRGAHPTPHKIECELVQGLDKGLEWLIHIPEGKKQVWEQALDTIYTYCIRNSSDLAEQMACSKRSAERYIKKLREREYLDGWNITSKGRELLEYDYA